MKNTTIALVSIASALLISSGLAYADDRRSNRAMMFDKADSNNDGKLSRDELMRARRPILRLQIKTGMVKFRLQKWRIPFNAAGTNVALNAY